MITEPIIKEELDSAIKAITLVYPLEKWTHKPSGLELVKSKTAWGLATPSGLVRINECFVGSSAIRKLRSTIRHELTHLAIGLQYGHGRRFKKAAKLFGIQSGVLDAQSILDEMDHKYTLYAHLQNGEKVDLGVRNRVSPSYLDYDPNQRKYKRIRDIKVVGFEYVENFASSL